MKLTAHGVFKKKNAKKSTKKHHYPQDPLLSFAGTNQNLMKTQREFAMKHIEEEVDDSEENINMTVIEPRDEDLEDE